MTLGIETEGSCPFTPLGPWTTTSDATSARVTKVVAFIVSIGLLSLLSLLSLALSLSVSRTRRRCFSGFLLSSLFSLLSSFERKKERKSSLSLGDLLEDPLEFLMFLKLETELFSRSNKRFWFFLFRNKSLVYPKRR